MTKGVKPRRLEFFVIDDNKVTLPDDDKIKVWRDESLQGARGASSVSTWLGHCTQAYRQKQVSFDALSIDVFFNRDRSDPYRTLPIPGAHTGSANKEKSLDPNLCSGLYHGLAAMARRRTQDEHGNSMPFAWEIRTASPKMPLTREQEVEIARIYGLLLALANPYWPDRGFLGLGNGADGSERPADLVLRAFREQEARAGAGIDMATSLLPQWRDRFLESVQAGQVKIDVSSLRRFTAETDAAILKPGFEPESIFGRPNADIALLNRRNTVVDRILLSSIFADQRINTAAAFQKIVARWLKQLIDSGAEDLTGFSILAAERVRAIAKYLRDSAGENKILLEKDFEKLSKNQQCLVLVSYWIAARLAPRKFLPQNLQDLLGLVNKRFNSQQARRLFGKVSGHTSIKNYEELDRDVLQRIENDGLVLPFSENFVRSLAAVLCLVGLKDDVLGGFPAIRPFVPE